ncbi:hypothetical protein ScalyP_jg7012 [Parmales sp. scaly parma]|nr:hypothetical protein ScalyP_jg7012 [Parmales sp. scaly parma]
MSRFQKKKPQPSPIVSIRERLVQLKSSREKTTSDIEQLENEKDEIEATLPVLLSKLLSLGQSVDTLNDEREIYNESIDRMTVSFGIILDPHNDDNVESKGEQLMKDLQTIAARYKKEQEVYDDEDGEEGEGEEREPTEVEEPFDEEKERREYALAML